jgi:hypothetical protein
MSGWTRLRYDLAGEVGISCGENHNMLDKPFTRHDPSVEA